MGRNLGAGELPSENGVEHKEREQIANAVLSQIFKGSLQFIALGKLSIPRGGTDQGTTDDFISAQGQRTTSPNGANRRLSHPSSFTTMFSSVRALSSTATVTLCVRSTSCFPPPNSTFKLLDNTPTNSSQPTFSCSSTLRITGTWLYSSTCMNFVLRDAYRDGPERRTVRHKNGQALNFCIQCVRIYVQVLKDHGRDRGLFPIATEIRTSTHSFASRLPSTTIGRFVNFHGMYVTLSRRMTFPPRYGGRRNGGTGRTSRLWFQPLQERG